MVLRPSAHLDSFARDHLPDPAAWPLLTFDRPELQYPDRLNCGAVLLDGAIEEGCGDRLAILHRDRRFTYADLQRLSDAYAQVLQMAQVRSGARVLLRGDNTPELFAAWLAVVRIGAIAVATMPMLRARELGPIIRKAQVAVALCEAGLDTELRLAAAAEPVLRTILTFGAPGADVEQAVQGRADKVRPVATSQDDVCLIAFTSGTTGEPKATMHFHRDVLAMCDTFARHVVRAGSDAIFSGTPPIAFTFGLGALLCFPLRVRAAVALPAQATPAALGEAVTRRRVTHLFTSPTGYRSLLARPGDYDLSSLRTCISAGEHLPLATWQAWRDATGLPLVDGIGATEMIHCFISEPAETIRPGSTGRPVPGYDVRLLDDDGRPIEGPGQGRLAVRGPTGCRYLDDPRQAAYVADGWNLTGDVFRRDEDGYYWYVARNDDMIVSSGYNISGLEVEEALLLHPAVQECAVVGWPDAERGHIVKALVVLRPGYDPGPDLVVALQQHVKLTLAPYKYPRAVGFVDSLPKTPTGKLQRSALRPGAAA